MCTYESILLQVSQVSQCLEVSLVSVVPPVELDTVQPVHLHTGHGALQRCLHHLHTGATLLTSHGSQDSWLEAQDSMSKHTDCHLKKHWGRGICSYNKHWQLAKVTHYNLVAAGVLLQDATVSYWFEIWFKWDNATDVMRQTLFFSESYLGVHWTWSRNPLGQTLENHGGTFSCLGPQLGKRQARRTLLVGW